MKVRGVFDLTWSKSSVGLLGALAVGLFAQTSFAADPVRESKSPSIPASVVSKLPGSVQAKLNSKQGKVSQAQQKAVKARLAERHHAFIENKGQWNSTVKFRAQSEGLDAWMTKTGITFDFFKDAVRNGRHGVMGQVVKMEFQGANSNPTIKGVAPLHSEDRFMSKNSSKSGVAELYKGVLSKDLYKGVDLKTYYSGSRVRYDLLVNPGADANAISMTFNGASSVEAAGQKLLLGTQLGKIAQGQLFAYQLVNGVKTQVPAAFKVEGKKVSFNLGAYDHSKTLVIDPIIYGSYLGGNNNWDEVHAIVSDTTGGVYITGTTQSTDYPLTAGPYFVTLKGATNAFLTRLEGDAYNIDYSVLFGGSNVDNPQFIQIDPYGSIWIAGTTTSPDFPGNRNTGSVVTSPSNPDIFVIRFQKSAALILDPLTVPETLMVTGPGSETLQGFAVVPVPNAPVSGPTNFILAGSPDSQPLDSNIIPTRQFDSQGAFLLSYQFTDAGGFSQNFGQYVGENNNFPVTISGVATDAAGEAYITGSVGQSGTNVDTSTTSVFTTTSRVFSNGVTKNPRFLQGIDLFIRKYDASGNILFSGLLGGEDDEAAGGLDINPDGTNYVSGSCIAVDAQGSAYIVGVSASFGYPRSRGSFGETWADGLPHVVVTKVSSDGVNVLYSTNLRDTFNAGSIVPSGIAVDGFGAAYITGNINSAPLIFPGPPSDPDAPTGYVPNGQPVVATGSTTPDAPVSTAWTTQAIPQIPGSSDYLNVLDPTATTLVYGTYLSGTLDNKVYAPYVDVYSDLWICGWTSGVRTYTVFGTTSNSPNPPFLDFSSLPAALITSKAFKTNDTVDSTQLLNWDFWDPNDPVNPGVLPILESRDGWLAKIRVGRPVVSAVTLAQTTIAGGLGAQTTATVTLSGPAPAEGAQVVVTLDKLSAASFASGSSLGSVTFIIPAGSTTSSAIPIFSLPVTTNTPVLVKATYDGNFIISALNVVPWLQNLSLNPTAVVGGNNVVGTITLSFPAPAGGVPVGVASASNLLTFPASGTVTVPAGVTSFGFTINTGGVDAISTVGASATALGVTKTSGLELDPASLLSVVVSPANVSSQGASITGTVSLTGLPGSQFPLITITVTDTLGNLINTYTVNPTTLTFAGTGNNSATFTISNITETATVSRLAVASMAAGASGTGYAAQTKSAQFTVDPDGLTGFTVTPTSPNPGDTLTATVTLGTSADQGGANVVLTSDTPSVIPIPAGGNPLVVLAGTATATLQLTVAPSATLVAVPVTLTATRNGTSRQVVINVQPTVATFGISDANGNSIAAILGGNTIQGTLTLTAPAPAGGLTVTLNSTPNGLATLSTPLTIAGTDTVTFPISIGQVLSDTTLTMSLTISDGTNSVTSNTQTITVNASGLQSLSFIPSSVRGAPGHSVLCKVILTGPAPAGGLVVTLTPNNASLFPGGSLTLTVPAGKVYASRTILVNKRVSRALGISWTASDPGGNIASAVLTVLR